MNSLHLMGGYTPADFQNMGMPRLYFKLLRRHAAANASQANLNPTDPEPKTEDSELETLTVGQDSVEPSNGRASGPASLFSQRTTGTLTAQTQTLTPSTETLTP